MVVPIDAAPAAGRLRRLFAALAIAAALTAGSVVAAAPAEASEARCSNGACTVYLNKAETLALSQGRVPKMNLGALTIPFQMLAQGHVLVAKGWVARGNCVAFTLNVRPWVSQGMVGTRCTS